MFACATAHVNRDDGKGEAKNLTNVTRGGSTKA
jgi:hypothetical protein